MSRLTVRQATGQLTQEGFLVGRRGEGTFVTDNVGLIESYHFEFRGLIDDFFFAQIADIKTKSTRIERMAAPRGQYGKSWAWTGRRRSSSGSKGSASFRETVFTASTNYLPLTSGRNRRKGALRKAPAAGS